MLDVWEPVKDRERNRERFFQSIIDEYSRRAAVYNTQTKSNVFRIFEEHIKRAECFLNTKVKVLRTDNGTEFSNQSFRSFCSKHEIRLFRHNKIEFAYTLIKLLWNYFWLDAAFYFTYTWNRICHKKQHKTLSNSTPVTKPQLNT